MSVIKVELSHNSYQSLVSDIDRYFSCSDVVLQDDRNTIKEVEFNGEVLVVKSYKLPGLINSFIYTYFRKSKAWRAYEYGLKVEKFTPSVIARVEYYQPLLKKSYLICKKFDADFNMQAPLFKQHPDKEKILKQFALFVFELHQNKIIHHDLSPGNILIKNSKEGYQFQIIDINRMIFKVPSTKERAQNFSKLWASDEDLTTILKSYAEVANLDPNFVSIGLEYNQRNKNGKNRKLKIKKALGLC
jgi:serine/threonine protein kinase